MIYENISKARDLLVFIEQNNEKSKIKADTVVEKLGWDIKEVFTHATILGSYQWVKGDRLNINLSDHGEIIINPSGENMAELMRNEKRWQNVLRICREIDVFYMDVAIDILRRLINQDIEKAL